MEKIAVVAPLPVDVSVRDPQRQGENSDNGEAWRLSKSAYSEAQIAKQAVESERGVFRNDALTGDGGVAEAQPCFALGFLAAHSGGEAVVDAHLHVLA